MTYPEIQYRGQAGMFGASVRRHDADPDLVTASGTRVHYLSTARTTNATFGVFKWEMDSSVSGAASHFHRTMWESFYVLEGLIRGFDGAEWVDLHAGDYLFVPPGAIHAFRNESGAPASMLIHFAPGAPREDYFEGLDRLRLTGVAPGDPEWIEFCRLHDNHLV